MKNPMNAQRVHDAKFIMNAKDDDTINAIVTRLDEEDKVFRGEIGKLQKKADKLTDKIAASSKAGWITVGDIIKSKGLTDADKEASLFVNSHGQIILNGYRTPVPANLKVQEDGLVVEDKGLQAVPNGK